MSHHVKWAWFLLIAATLGLVLKLVFWLLPAPFWGHARSVADAAEEGLVMPTDAPAGRLPTEPAPTPERKDLPEDPTNDWPPAPMPMATPPPAPPPPPPEQYHFRKIRWGMIPAEVRHAEGLEPIYSSDNRLDFISTIQGLPCILSYYFLQGQLFRARLLFSDSTGMSIPPLSAAQAQQHFLFLRTQLQRRYGPPIEIDLTVPRDTTALQRAVLSREELVQQYDSAIAEAEERLIQERARLERRFERWQRRAEMIARGLESFQRDVAEMKQWKQDAMDQLTLAQRGIEQRRTEDRAQPLLAGQLARWPDARNLHNIELRLDYRQVPLRLELRYAATQRQPTWDALDEL